MTGAKFYCSARATHSVNRGNWYFEIKVVELPEGAAVRVGWAQKNANLQAPLGFDKFGYRCVAHGWGWHLTPVLQPEEQEGDEVPRLGGQVLQLGLRTGGTTIPSQPTPVLCHISPVSCHRTPPCPRGT